MRVLAAVAVLAVAGFFGGRFYLARQWQAVLLPDLLDSLENVRRFNAPLLVEHGTDDEMFPVEWGKQLAAAHPGAQLAVIAGMHHADPVAHPSPSSWDPVIRFVRNR